MKRAFIAMVLLAGCGSSSSPTTTPDAAPRAAGGETPSPDGGTTPSVCRSEVGSSSDSAISVPCVAISSGSGRESTFSPSASADFGSLAACTMTEVRSVSSTAGLPCNGCRLSFGCRSSRGVG